MALLFPASATVAVQGRNARLHVFEADIRIHVGRGSGAGVAQVKNLMREEAASPDTVVARCVV
jgi:hypothetical protein